MNDELLQDDSSVPPAPPSEAPVESPAEAAPPASEIEAGLSAAMETQLPEGDPGASSVPAGPSAVEIKGDLGNIIQALLFATDEPLSVQTLKDILSTELDQKTLRAVVLEINKDLQAERRPFEIVEVGGGFQFRTIASYQRYLKGLFKDKALRRLSGQALETLAIIAYKQPVSRAEIESIRNVSTDSALKTLLEKRLIKILGKSEEKPGKPIVYGTTRDFLRYFGLNRISDLPKIEEFEEIAKAQEKSDLIQDYRRPEDHETTMQSASYAVPVEDAGSEPASEASPDTALSEGPAADARAEAVPPADDAKAPPADSPSDPAAPSS